MRKLIISLAAAGTALGLASPAAAQYYPGQSYYGGQPYGYGYNGYGYGNFGAARALQARIDRIEWQINRLGDWRGEHLRREAERLERRLNEHARNGLNPYEVQDISFRIDRLEQQVRYAYSYGYGRYGYGDRDDHRGWDRDGDGNHDRD